MHLFSGLAFRSPLHARALQNLEGRALSAMRSVALKVGTTPTRQPCSGGRWPRAGPHARATTHESQSVSPLCRACRVCRYTYSNTTASSTIPWLYIP